jgi:hypothetical protein
MVARLIRPRSEQVKLTDPLEVRLPAASYVLVWAGAGPALALSRLLVDATV